VEGAGDGEADARGTGGDEDLVQLCTWLLVGDRLAAW
jgi:hypothetical protein